MKMRIVYALLGIGFSLAFMNGCSDDNPQEHADEKDKGKGKGNPELSFLDLAKACGQGNCNADALDVAFDKLDDAAIKALADEKDGDLNVAHMLVKAKLEPKVVSVIGKFLNKLEALEKTKVDEQLDHQVGGEDVVAVVRKADRPSGEDAGERHSVLAHIAMLRSAQLNKLVTGANTPDVDVKPVMTILGEKFAGDFLRAASAADKKAAKDSYLAFRNTMVTGAGAVLDFLEARNALRNSLIRATYGVPASADTAGVTAALTKVSELMTENFFSKAELEAKVWNPFDKPNYTGVKLLYALLDQAKDVGGTPIAFDQALVRAASAPMKVKIGADWNAYLVTADNERAGSANQAINDFLSKIPGMPTTTAGGVLGIGATTDTMNTANAWLDK